MPGFDSRAEAEFAAGTVRGIRRWTLNDDRELVGNAAGVWAGGENVARCNTHADHDPPVLDYEIPRSARGTAWAAGQMSVDTGRGMCGCGFWAYWAADDAARHGGAGGKPVVGVIEGYGRVLIGDRGFRCAKARIVGLALAFDITAPAGLYGPGWRPAFADPPPSPHPDAMAIKAAYEDSLAARYPGATVYTTPAIMLALCPPTGPGGEPVAPPSRHTADAAQTVFRMLQLGMITPDDANRMMGDLPPYPGGRPIDPPPAGPAPPTARRSGRMGGMSAGRYILDETPRQPPPPWTGRVPAPLPESLRTRPGPARGIGANTGRSYWIGGI